MCNKRRFSRSLFGVMLVCLGLLVASVSRALTPTPAQIEQFKAMSPTEQRALAKSFGVELPVSLGNVSQQAPVSEPQTVTPRDPEEKEAVTTTVTESRGVANTDNEEAEATAAPEREEKHLLKPFGYDLFAGNPSTFAPATDIPVPTDYVIGPGDTIIVQLYGKENATYELVVSREGQMQFPELGPISVNGLNFGELKARVNQLVSAQMIGVKASVTMGALRSIRVFVLGDAHRPGSYTVSSLSTMTNALFASGGIKEIGSLRKIQLKRRGALISTLDLYDLLLHGDTSKDRRLLPGDVIFIPTVKTTAAILGEVKRPAIYELNDSATSMQELVALAGGYSATAYPEASRVERINSKGQRTVVDLDLSTPAGQHDTVKNGDVLKVYSVLDKLENVVVLSGHVHRPGFFRWKKGMRVKEVIGSVGDLLPNPDLSVALLKHETGPERLLSFELLTLGKALAGDASANKRLSPRDEVIVFGAGNGERAAVMEEFVAVLRQQAAPMSYPSVVEIRGDVKSPGQYPIAQGMGAQELIELAGGLKPEAQDTLALLVERTERPGRFAIQYVDLRSKAASKTLSPSARVYVLSNVADRADLLAPLIREIENQSWHGDRLPLVNVHGSVRFPGQYPYMSGSTVKDMIALAGGLREEAYLLSGEITRSRVKNGSTFEIFHQELDLTRADETGMGMNLNPRDGLTIKRIPEWEEMITVSIAGEVLFPGKYPIVRGETLLQLIERAGGLTDEADAKGAVFLRASLRRKEQEALSDMKQRLATEVTRLENDAKQGSDAITEQRAVGARLLSEVEKAEAMGRLVIDLPGMLANRQHKGNTNGRTLLLREGDSLVIPPRIQEVSIVGEVQHPTSHLYTKRINGKKYIQKSGGVTRNGDLKRAYVINRDGNVKPLRKRFLFLSRYGRVQPGDTIVVPFDVDKVSPVTYWSQISQILFQLATTAAALETVGAL
ncbi:MAG: SLBB domain-containing protein [Gammaproteobacteria bacterium]